MSLLVTSLVEMCYCMQHVQEHLADLTESSKSISPKRFVWTRASKHGRKAWEMLPYSFQIPLLEGNMSVHVGKRRESE